MAFVDLFLPEGHGGACWRYSDRHVRNASPHRHAEIEANLVLRGHASYLIGERTRQMLPGELLWLFPDQDHLLVDASPDFDMWIAVFRPDFLDRRGIELPKMAEDAPEVTEARILPPNLADDLSRLANEINAQGSDPAIVDAGLAWWLLRAWRDYAAGEPAPTRQVHPAVQRATMLLRDDPSLDLPTLAKAAGLSASRLSRLFVAQMGVSVTQLRNRVRLDRVDAIMARATSTPLLTAALSAGFGSYAQFFRVFQSTRHVSPNRYYGQHGG
ncbi:MAG: helix-turn-helix transcriptional regulator [Pseudomonadota bacterium]